MMLNRKKYYFFLNEEEISKFQQTMSVKIVFSCGTGEQQTILMAKDIINYNIFQYYFLLRWTIWNLMSTDD